MARATNMLLMLVGCVILATAVLADETITKRYSLSMFEHDGREDLVFEAQNKGSLRGKIQQGQGFVYNNKATASYEPNSKQVGSVGGMYFATIARKVTEVSSVVLNYNGAQATLSLRGRWALDKNGQDLSFQELAIVGGTKEFAGAYGTLKYTKTGPKVWLIQATIDVDVVSSAAQA